MLKCKHRTYTFTFLIVRVYIPLTITISYQIYCIGLQFSCNTVTVSDLLSVKKILKNIVEDFRFNGFILLVFQEFEAVQIHTSLVADWYTTTEQPAGTMVIAKLPSSRNI